MTAVISNNNNTVIPLLPLIPWSGSYELVNAYTALSLALRSSSNVIITVYQSIDGTSIDDQSVYIAKANVFFSIQAQLYYKYCKISLLNSDGIPQTFISFMTRWMSVLPLPLDLSNVSITGTSNVNIVGGTLSLASGSNTIGSVSVNNLITQTLATRRVDFLVVGVWYRVASVGLTTGAQWNAIGAIVDGESVPVIGRLFQCLSVGSAVAGGGECYDVEYTTDINCNITNIPAIQPVSGTVSLTDPTTVRISGTYGDPITTTAGNLMVGINNIYTTNPLHTIVDNSVTILNSSIINTFTYASISGNWVSDSVDLRVYSLADLYMLSAGSVSSILGMTFIGQYSPDNIHWFDSGNTLQLTTATPQGIAVGILTASPYIRLRADPANAPGDTATDVSLWIPAKAI